MAVSGIWHPECSYRVTAMSSTAPSLIAFLKSVFRLMSRAMYTRFF